jgi:hypothetical protein
MAHGGFPQRKDPTHGGNPVKGRETGPLMLRPGFPIAHPTAGGEKQKKKSSAAVRR